MLCKGHEVFQGSFRDQIGGDHRLLLRRLILHIHFHHPEEAEHTFSGFLVVDQDEASVQLLGKRPQLAELAPVAEPVATGVALDRRYRDAAQVLKYDPALVGVSDEVDIQPPCSPWEYGIREPFYAGFSVLNRFRGPGNGAPFRG